MRALLCFLVCTAPVGAVHHFKDLNRFRDLEQLGVIESSGNGELSGRALKHTLLGFGRTECVPELRQLGFPGDYGQLGEHFETGEVLLDRHEEMGRAFNVSNCKQFVFIPKGSKVSEFKVMNAEDKSSLNNWVYDHLKAELEVINDLEFEISVKWEDNMKVAKDLVKVPPNKSARIHTFDSHHLVFFAKHGRKYEPLVRVRVDGSGTLRMSDYVHGDLTQQCENPEDCDAIKADDAIQLTKEDMETWKVRDTNNFQRIIRNEEQPASKPFFTELGFKKMRIPDDIYKLMLDRFQAGKANPIEEPWSKSDCHTNFFEVPSRMVYLTDAEKKEVFAGLQPILEEWAGVKLKPTSCYGVRMYYNGSWLREHVDTGSTHIISAIAQIAQEGMEEPWALTFVDHKGGRHYITMEPQDLVLYESATCLHGRPKPMRGGYFANVFTHFKPQDWA